VTLPSELDAKIQAQNTTEQRMQVYLNHYHGEVFKTGEGLVKVLTGEMSRNPRITHGHHYLDHEHDGEGLDESESCATDDEECLEAADYAYDYEDESCATDDEECANAEADEENEDAAADEEDAEEAALAARKNGDIFAKLPMRNHFHSTDKRVVKKPELKGHFAAKDVTGMKANNEKDSAPKQMAASHAQLSSNQQRLYSHMQVRTYPEWDSNSYISPYNQADHAWTVSADAEGTLSHYDVYNETHWVDQSMVDGYKIPITADDGNSFVQRRTYPEWDSGSYISPYDQSEHAWTVRPDAEGTISHYDASNETHWVDQSMIDGYKIPITADDNNALA
jgi:hypothetical protein